MHIVNLDIKKAYDSVIRADVRSILEEIGCPAGTINLWHMLNHEPVTKLAVGGGIVGKFTNKRGIRQGA